MTRSLAAAILIASAGCGPGTSARRGDTAPPLDEIESSPGNGTLEGAITDVATDRPVSFAEITVYREGSGELAGETTSDQSGRYRVPNLPPGSYRIVVEFSSLRTESRGVTVLADRPTPLRIELSSHPESAERRRTVAHEDALGAIEGQVIDGVRGAPLGGATVEVSSDRSSEPLFTIADEQGRFRVPGLAPGRYLVSVYYSLVDKGNIEIRRSGVAVERGKVTQLTLELDTQVR